ncbi:MAG: minichromosome maintenance protein MCM [archaeon]
MSEPVYVQKFEDFFSAKYKKELEKLAEFYPAKRSLNVDYKILEEHDLELADELIQKPSELIESAEEAVKNMNVASSGGEPIAPHVRFFNLPPESTLIVKNINSSYLGKLISVEGVVTKITEVKPKLVNAVFECNHCGRIYSIPQNDKSGKITEPGACSCERRSFSLIAEQSRFIDTQKFEIQEPLEKVRGGELSRKISVVIDDDLTNVIIPGDKLMVTGTLMLHPPKSKGAIYDLFIDANHTAKLEKEFEELVLSEEEEKKIKELSKDPKLYEKIVASIAPSIYGHSEIKEAIALQLFGGTPNKVKADGMKIRPDMHILLIGDPGTAKSQLLQYVKILSPKGIYVSGKSSSAAGLTATAEKDDYAEGGWTLKAGALVLAAGGMAMIDEFDKMGDEDRSSMHEAMEAQEIHVAKAGIIATFKANASILAAANPKYGRFDPNELPANQFDIPPTIMSRFDLIFPIRDVLDEKRDKEMADHILTSHFTSAMKQKKEYNAEEIAAREKRVLPIIEPELLRSYIAYARINHAPVLSEEAMAKIKEFYLELRKMGESQGSVPITARYLEGVVRLSEASAKGRLSDTVDFEDAERAIRLLKYSLKEIGMDPETGKLDIDILATGMSHSRVDKIRNVTKIIKSLASKMGEAKMEDIIEECKLKNIDAEEVEEIINQLKRDGNIYSPRYGVYKPADKE